MKITGATKNKKFVAMISLISLLSMVNFAPAQAGDSKSKRVIELANPSGVVVTPASTSLAITFNRVPNASSYTVRVYQGSNEKLVGSARTLFNPGNSVTGLTPSTEYKVSVQAIGNGTTYSNSDDSRKVKTRTTGPVNTPFNINWVSNCPDALLCTPASGGQNFYIATQAITTPASTPSQPGFTFTGWSSNNPNVVSTNFPTTPRSTFGAVTFTGQWRVNTYTVTWDTNCSLQCTPGTGGQNSYTAGQAITTPSSDPSRPGFTFDGWASNNPVGASTPSTPLSPFGNVVFTAKWIANTYSVTWNTNCPAVLMPFTSCTDASGGSPSYITGTTITTPSSNPSAPGWTFDGWTSSSASVVADLSSTSASTHSPVSAYGNLIFTAKWSPKTYALIWNAACLNQSLCTGGSGGASTYLFQTPITQDMFPSVPSEPGRSFMYWSDAFGIDEVNNRITVTALWETITYSVTWNSDCDPLAGCTPAANGSSTYTAGQSIAVASDPSKPGFRFDGWTSSNPNVSDTSFPTTPSSTYGDVVFTAKWVAIVAPVTFRITWDPQCPSDIQLASGCAITYTTYTRGQAIGVDAPYAYGSNYQINYWYLEQDNGNNGIEVNRNFVPGDQYGDITVIPNWYPYSPNPDMNPGNGGGDNGGGGPTGPVTFGVTWVSGQGTPVTDGPTFYIEGDVLGGFPTNPTADGQNFDSWFHPEFGTIDSSFIGPFGYGPIEFYAVWSPNL